MLNLFKINKIISFRFKNVPSINEKLRICSEFDTEIFDGSLNVFLHSLRTVFAAIYFIALYGACELRRARSRSKTLVDVQIWGKIYKWLHRLGAFNFLDH